MEESGETGDTEILMGVAKVWFMINHHNYYEMLRGNGQRGPSGGRGRGRGWRGYHGNQGNRGRWRGTNNDRIEAPPPSKRPRLVQTPLISCPYIHWNTYLPTESYVGEYSKLAIKLKAFEKYFDHKWSGYNIDYICDIKAVSVNYVDMITSSFIKDAVPDIVDEIKNIPELSLSCMGLAFHTVLEKSLSPSQDVSTTTDEVTKSNTSLKNKYNIRLYGIDVITPMRHIKAPLFGKCVCLKGTIVRVSSIKPLVIKMAFRCLHCSEIQAIEFTDGKYSLPTKCPADGCNSKSFAPLRSSSLTETIDSQTVRLQEQSSSGDRCESGRVPRTIDCELTADMVDTCVPGDTVTVAAIVKATGSHDDGRSRSSKDKCTFSLYLRAVSIFNNKSNEGGPPEGGPPGGPLDFSDKDLQAIKEIHEDKDTLKLLVGSLCPTIYGHEVIKVGLLLGLFGGCQDFTDNHHKVSLSIRGNPHILVVGDPGLGKSQMLQAAANCAPRGVYVSGNTTTSSGLTVTMTKDGSANEYALEAGALVLGDQGCCCIDEFDKMGSQHQSLLEAMEQQSISIAKAGIVCTLPARTSILAAANPMGGHYNKAKTVSENLKMNSALLSRFDLVFILLDKPDEEMDNIISNHVMSLHTGMNKAVIHSGVVRRTSEGSIDVSLNDGSLLCSDNSLAERIKIQPHDNIDPIPAPLLRKYISYSRTFIHPKLTPEAITEIQEFYLQLRNQRQQGDSTPITTRQLESLIRLTEARARVELREDATQQDARDVIEIMKFSMRDTYSDEYGFLDYQRSQHGSGMSQKTQARRFVSELGRLAERNGSSLFTWTQLKEFSQALGLQIKNFDDFISSLNQQGYLLIKGPKLYKLLTCFD
jgi:DNA helicase MCM8